MEQKYYDGTRLLSLMDINGKRPEIYISTSNRSAGKTTYFNRFFVNRFLTKKEKFLLIYRFQDELADVDKKFFDDIQGLFFQNYEMYSRPIGKSKMYELFIKIKNSDNEGLSCGYAVALNCADKVKKYSHLLSDVERGLFDEFQSETNHYCSDEVNKLISIHTSVSRGQGKQVRYVPFYLISNAVSLLNPYFNALGISERLKSETKFLKGDGYVLEQNYNESASTQQKESAFNRAFKKSKYVEYSSMNSYLNDNTAFIEKITGNSKYMCTLKYKGSEFAVRSFDELGIIYCDKKVDPNFPRKISVTTDDHNINYVMLSNYDYFLSNLRYFFEVGVFRFKDLECKECILKALSY